MTSFILDPANLTALAVVAIYKLFPDLRDSSTVSNMSSVKEARRRPSISATMFLIYCNSEVV